MWGKAREERATVNEGVERWVREIRKKAVKYRRALAAGMSVWHSVFNMGSRKARADFHWYFSTWQWVFSLFFSCRKTSLEYSCMYRSWHTHHTPHTHTDVHTSPHLSHIPTRKFSWLGTAAFPCLPGPASQVEIVPKIWGEGRLAFCCQLSWLASVSHPWI